MDRKMTCPEINSEPATTIAGPTMADDHVSNLIPSATVGVTAQFTCHRIVYIDKVRIWASDKQ